MPFRFLITILSACIASTAHAQVTNEDIRRNFSANSTEAQRTNAWEKIDGGYGVIRGIVHDVDVPGWLEPYYKVSMDDPQGDLFYVCKLDKEFEALAVSLRYGDLFTCHGQLINYVYIFGGAGIYIDYEE